MSKSNTFFAEYLEPPAQLLAQTRFWALFAFGLVFPAHGGLELFPQILRRLRLALMHKSLFGTAELHYVFVVRHAGVPPVINAHSQM